MPSPSLSVSLDKDKKDEIQLISAAKASSIRMTLTFDATFDDQFDSIEENFIQNLDELTSILDVVLAISSDDVVLNLLVDRRAKLFENLQLVATEIFLRRSFETDELKYLSRMGVFHRRLALKLENGNDFQIQRRVRHLFFDVDENLFEFLIEILPTICQYETDVIEMILPWYEALIFFERNSIDSTLDEHFQRFNRQIIQCLKSSEYERSFLIIENHQTMTFSVRHRFYLGVCTMSMGVHVNCDSNECEQSKELFEFYLSRYIDFIRAFSHRNLPCLTGIVTFLVNYTLNIEIEQNRQLLFELFSLIVDENLSSNLRSNWSTNETILFDSIFCYLIVCCHSDRLIVEEIVQRNETFVESLEKIIEKAERVENRRVAILCQLFFLILLSRKPIENLSLRLFSSCCSFVENSLKNSPSFHVERIPLNVFLQSFLQIVQNDKIQQKIFDENLTKIFLDVLDRRESISIILNILWSISFNEQIKKQLKNYGETFFELLNEIRRENDDSSVKQTICGLLFNLDRLKFLRTSPKTNFGKTIGISFDSSDSSVVQMIEHELNRLGHRVWTRYDEMSAEFLPSFAAMLSKTKFLIVCLSEMYRTNNRCRAELLYAISIGHQVVSWKIQRTTTNVDENFRILLRRIDDDEEKPVEIDFRPTTNPNQWTNAQVVRWCRQMKFVAFEKLISGNDGRALLKLYEFSKTNSPETISMLNKELNRICDEENLPTIVLSVQENIRFQIEFEKFLLVDEKKRFKWKFCRIF